MNANSPLAKMFSVVLFCTFLAFSLAMSAEDCRLKPRLWCSSRKVAKRYDVERRREPFLKPNKKAPLVHFTLYFESLCPFCKYFITSQLYPTFKAIGDIMNLALVPYGNAREKQVGNKWQFTCQHGKEECYGNLIETCAIHYHPSTTDYFPFIHCIEKSQSNPRESAPGCAKRLGLDYSQIKNCADGPLGNTLEHQMGLKTESLQPPRKYVPWVTLNGVHTKKIQSEASKDLKKLICDTYQGSPKPDACSKTTGKKRRENDLMIDIMEN